MARRSAAVYAACILLFMSMIMQLFVASQGRQYAQAAARQSTCTLEAGTARGVIYDCHFQPLVGRQDSAVTAVVPTPQSAAWLLGRAAGSRRTALLAQLQGGRPFLYAGDLTGCPDASVFHLPVRYGPGSLAPHVVGYLDSGGRHGVAGIEAACDGLLRGFGGRRALRCQVDAAGHALAGGAEAVGSSAPPVGGVVLTLDSGIQRAAQQALDESGCPAGAVVVLDIWTGAIRAMASAPAYDQNDVAAALGRSDAPLLNRALCAYSVGSTFKLAVAAAALEQGIPAQTSFSCPGYALVDGQVFHCHNLAGHGSLDMQQALEHSCNVYFIQLARRVGAAPVRAMAQRLGFGRATQLAQGLRGAAGSLTPLQDLTGGEFANFSFGQGQLTATPLQLAVMTAAIANGGQTVVPRLVQGTTADGRTLSQTVPEYAVTRAMSVKTAAALQQMMIGVVTGGSGSAAAPAAGGAGGKTASAQTGVTDSGGREVVHAWFSGFYPAQTPHWAIVVLCEGGGSGGSTAAPVFRRVADAIAALGYVADDSKMP